MTPDTVTVNRPQLVALLEMLAAMGEICYFTHLPGSAEGLADEDLGHGRAATLAAVASAALYARDTLGATLDWHEYPDQLRQAMAHVERELGAALAAAGTAPDHLSA
jgi:hypothetical protein